jgi:hypothetical protein
VSFLASARRSPESPSGSPYCSEKSCSARVLVTLRTAAGMKVDSSHSDGNTPMPGCGLSLILWNMPRISEVAFTGAGPWRLTIQCAALQPAATVGTAAAGAAASSLLGAPASRTKKPRFLRASTSPCASNWS